MTILRTTLHNPPDVPAPAGNYSHVARLELGDGALLIVSGQLALGADGQVIGAGDMARQSDRVFEILGAILAAHDATLADAINIRTYLTDISLIDDYATARARHLENPPPTSTTVEVSRLLIPGALVEVDLMATAPPAPAVSPSPRDRTVGSCESSGVSVRGAQR